MNSTKNYVIRLTSNSREHALLKREFESLFLKLNKKFEGDIERYIEPINSNNKRWGNKPIIVSKEKTLVF